MKKLFIAILSIVSLAPLSVQAQKGITKSIDFATGLTIVTNRYDNGKKSTEYSQNAQGLKEGQEIVWYQNGQKQMVRNWKNGKLDGEGVHYHRNGKLHYKEFHTNGVKTGTWTFYDEEGTPVQEIQYGGSGNDGTYTYYHGGVAYFKQVIENGSVAEERVLNQTVYDQAKAEAEAAAKQGK